MSTRRVQEEAGMAIIVVLLMIFIFVAAGAFIILAVDRNGEMRGTFQKSVAGFQAAEAGINLGAASVLNEMSNNQLPTGSDCNAKTTTINQRTVTYTLSGCGQSSVLQVLPADDPFAGVNAYVYTYTLTSTAVNSLGFTEASLKMQFYARQIPVFQFMQFNKQDLALTPGPAYLASGRIHTNGDLYLSNQDCGGSGSTGGGLQVLGPVTIVGNLWRGARTTNDNYGHVWLSKDGTQGNEVILGENSQGDATCNLPPGSNPRRGPIPASEITTFGGRVRTGVKNVILPGGAEMYCAPWDCPAGMTAGANVYWQKADLRLVLDLTAAPVQLKSGTGPALYPVKVLDSLGNLDSARTNALITMMQNQPGIITYTDVPCGGGTTCPTAGGADCRASITGNHPNCEGNYNYTPDSGRTWPSYNPPFPAWHSAGCGGGSFLGRGPRTTITASNYCYDYRYGGYYSWRDDKPLYVLNVDWMALEEYNRNNANVFFNPAGATSTNNGVVIFLSVEGLNSSSANDYAVRVYDAARVRRGTSDPGITFASDQALLTVGTFNCPQPNTSGGTGVPETCGPGGALKPASLAADTVDVLSCAWIQQAQDCKTYLMDTDQWAGVGTYRPFDENSTTGREPPGAPPFQPGGVGGATTYVNAALLAGWDQPWCPSNPSGIDCGTNWNASGSPSLNEDWTGQQFWYRGSFVSLDATKHTCWAVAAQGVTNDPSFPCNLTLNPGQGFQAAQRYAPPQRLFFYDPNFNTPANWPPLAPFFVSLKQVLFTEPFQ